MYNDVSIKLLGDGTSTTSVINLADLLNFTPTFDQIPNNVTSIDIMAAIEGPTHPNVTATITGGNKIHLNFSNPLLNGYTYELPVVRLYLNI